eukprot:970841-Amphidinium_carterae.1
MCPGEGCCDPTGTAGQDCTCKMYFDAAAPQEGMQGDQFRLKGHRSLQGNGHRQLPFDFLRTTKAHRRLDIVLGTAQPGKGRACTIALNVRQRLSGPNPSAERRQTPAVAVFGQNFKNSSALWQSSF